MNDTADPSSRRYRFNPRVFLSCAIFALSVSLVPAYVVATVGVATIGEAEATTHVETTEAVADRKGHKPRRRSVIRRMLWQGRLLATRQDETGKHWRDSKGERLPLRPCHSPAPTRAPPTSR